ncbi:bifunctional DNA-formamidopyrimidine glycosylase/DNA-(apurinic or apyrimidinic site) lyase [Woodsholea maritima]|uniref:bifunctional DNA-formamidopyrimidine glycosylase/DNA-(apurinic or apyrimidinic site) lyase n=1 Tax=Woodsholea maritima TaxID=240237 RepID=UPI000372C324|nr:bifunctional DNA-formamidopyrimidine glycosylase/DNA-(apurinic or apyrimidinic site) lyase [Woodsholea maritima]
MPELPEVETVRRGLIPAMVGRCILRAEINRPDLRFPFPDNMAARLEGARVEVIERRSKYLLIRLSSEETLLAHLGMSGRFSILAEDLAAQPGDFVYAARANPKHDHVVLHLEGGVEVRYNDPRRFGFMMLYPSDGDDRHPALKDLGPEPLSNALDDAYLTAKLLAKRSSIKALLLDQRIIAGLGNIYVCEALYRAGLHPEVSGSRLIPQDVERLLPHIRAVIAEAIEAGGSTLKDYAGVDGALGYFQHRFKVYGREGEACLAEGCTASIERIVQNGRSTFFCPACQRDNDA